MEEKFIETDNGRIYYWHRRVSDTRPTVVFLHGLSSNHLTFTSMVAKLNENGYSTIALDLRGHGLSDKRRKRELYRIPVMTRDLHEVLVKENLRSVCIVGYSYGAYVGIDFAITYPTQVEKLILISPNIVSPFNYGGYPWVTPIMRVGVNFVGWLFLWQSKRKYRYFDPEEAPGYWRSTFGSMTTMPISINLWMLSEVFALDYRSSLSRIEAPTLLTRGKHDRYVTEREINDMASKLKHSEVLVQDHGHYITSAHHEIHANEILRFLSN